MEPVLKNHAPPQNASGVTQPPGRYQTVISTIALPSINLNNALNSNLTHIENNITSVSDLINCALQTIFSSNPQDFSQFRENLQTSIKFLASPQTAFAHQIVSQLLLEEHSFECQVKNMDKGYLPLPLSHCWIPDYPQHVTVFNPVLRTFFKGCLYPNAYNTNYQKFFQKIISKNLDKLDVIQKIKFRQIDIEYEFELTMRQTIFLFFPKLAVEIFKLLPVNTRYDFLDFYPFTMSDQRFEGQVASKTCLLESLIAADNLSQFPEEVLHHPHLRLPLMKYLAFLLHYGNNNTPTQLILRIQTLYYIFKISFKLLKPLTVKFDEKSDYCSFYYYVYDSLKNLLIKIPESEKIVQSLSDYKKIAALPPPPNWENYERRKDFFFVFKPENSFLLKDFVQVKQKMTEEPDERTHKKLKTSNGPITASQTSLTSKAPVFTDPREYAQTILDTLAKNGEGLHIILLKDESLEEASLKNLLVEQLSSTIFSFWQAFQQRVPTAQFFKKSATYVFKHILSENYSSSNPFNYLAMHLTSLLEIRPLRTLYQKMKFEGGSRYHPNSIGQKYIVELLKNPAQNNIGRFKNEICSAALKVKTHLYSLSDSEKNQYKHNVPEHPVHAFLKSLDTVITLCTTSSTMDLIKVELERCFNIYPVHSTKPIHRELFFAQFIFAGLLTAIQPDPQQNRPYTELSVEALESIIKFNPLDIIPCSHPDLLFTAINTIDPWVKKKLFLITKMPALQKHLHLLDGVEKSIRTIHLFKTDQRWMNLYGPFLNDTLLKRLSPI